MEIYQNWWEIIIPKIDALPVGFKGGLAEICGDEWSSMGTKGEHKSFGTYFHKIVDSGEIPCLKFHSIALSGRHNVYEKINNLPA